MDLNKTSDTKRVLMVGAGGIGCELLKNLVLTNFTEVDVIDLDTIELSNLNRQFLFQKSHVGKPKALIAKESVLRFNPKANINAYHDSIMSPKYNVEYFKQFSIVLSALDNKAARSHVNRLCLAADVPLIESGSSGYLGQVALIKKGLTECYDCTPKTPAKTFPGCTIRNTPSEPIHCIVWAKHLFNQLFGSEDPDEAVSPDGEDPENMAIAGELALKKASTEEAVNRVSTRQWAKSTNYDSAKIFNKLFNEDIKYLLSMAKLWEKRKAPTPLDWTESMNNHLMPSTDGPEQQKGQSSASTADNGAKKPELASHQIWTISECCGVFSKAVSALHKRLGESSDDPNSQILCWDKDDEDAMSFVAAAANLRCFIFSIGVKSKFEIKSLAGNIIPAIATTNAIVAGLIVIQALKVIENKLNNCRNAYIREKPILPVNRLIVSEDLPKANPKCYVCASKPEVIVKLNLSKFTIKQLETKILKQELNMIQPDVEIDDGTGRIIISSEEGETEENNDKTLSHFGLVNQSRLKCDDFFQNFEIRITLYHRESDPHSTKDYEVVTDAQTLRDIQDQIQTGKQAEEEARKQIELNAAEPDLLIEPTETMVPSPNEEAKKRSYEAAFDDEEDKSASNELANKKSRPSDEGVVIEAVDGMQTVVDQDDSDSINDASDALSEEEAQADDKNGFSLVTIVKSTNSTATPKQSKFNKPLPSDVIEEEDELLEEDNDCIIEENSNDVRNAEMSSGNQIYPENTTSTYESSDLQQNVNSSSDLAENINSNEVENDDDDVIECDGDEDAENYADEEKENNDDDCEVIEINGESNNNYDQGTNSTYGVVGFNDETASSNCNQYQNGSSRNCGTFHEEGFESVEVRPGLKSVTGVSGNSINGSLNGNRPGDEESDEGVTVIE